VAANQAAGQTPAAPAVSTNPATPKTTAPPGVNTGSASRIRTSRATLNGTVNPAGQAASYYFQFGTTTAYGLQTPPADAGSGTANVAVSTNLSGLASGTSYHYRLVAQSAGGISFGTDQNFRTSGPPTVNSQIDAFGKTGFVSPGGFVGVVVGCFGPTRCGGQITMTRGNTLIAQRGFGISPDSGGMEILRLSGFGQQQRRRFQLVQRFGVV